MKIKSLILKSALLVSFFLGGSLYSQDKIDEERKALSKDERIEIELDSIREIILKSRTYKRSIRTNSPKYKITISPYELAGAEAPDWWSERQAYDISYVLLKALNHYPGLEAKLSRTWEQNLLEKENIFKLPENEQKKVDLDNKESENFITTIQDKFLRILNKGNQSVLKNGVKLEPKVEPQNIYINPIINEYKFQTLSPKVKGFGLGFVALNSKTCSNETFLDSSYQISKPFDAQSSSSGFILDEIVSKQLITKKTKGSSLNFNLLVGGTGGGKYKPPEKPVKEIIYSSVVDAAEGIYCAISEDKQCLKYYAERDYEYPTVEKKSKKKKKKKAGC